MRTTGFRAPCMVSRTWPGCTSPCRGPCWRCCRTPTSRRGGTATVKCGDLLWALRHPCIDLLGTGYYHPVLPLDPARGSRGACPPLAGHRRSPFPAALPGFLAAGDGLLHGDDPPVAAAGLSLRDRGQRTRHAHDAHALGGDPVPASPRAFRGRGNDRDPAGPGSVGRPGGRHGDRLVHPGGSRSVRGGAPSRRWCARPPTATTAGGSGTRGTRPTSGARSIIPCATGRGRGPRRCARPSSRTTWTSTALTGRSSCAPGRGTPARTAARASCNGPARMLRKPPGGVWPA